MRTRKLIPVLAFFLSVILVIIFLGYRLLFGTNLKTEGKKITLLIPEGSTYLQALDTIKAHFKISNPDAFDWISKKKNYPRNVKPGSYVIDRDLSYTGLIDLLRSGRQTPVNVTFNNTRYLSDLAGKIGGRIEADSTEIMEFLTNPDNYAKDGFTRENIISVFIPNTYEFYWNTSAKELYTRMLREYRNFWNADRTARAEEMNLNPIEISILASIVDEEAVKSDEKPRIAGVYLNRLKRGMPFQADPTIKFALNDFSITRVLTKHLAIDSPYNTYKYKGLPPGPIGCPSIESIDAVLQAEKHDYLYFAAKADFSGYHNFSRTLSEHNRYAAEYRRELNRRKIYR